MTATDREIAQLRETIRTLRGTLADIQALAHKWSGQTSYNGIYKRIDAMAQSALDDTAHVFIGPPSPLTDEETE